MSGLVSPITESVKPTYDSSETGPQYWVTSTVSDRPAAFRRLVDDPFVRHTVHVGWLDLIRAVLRGRLEVEVTVGGAAERMYDVLELDAQTLIRGRTRRIEFDQQMHESVKRFGEEVGQ